MTRPPSTTGSCSASKASCPNSNSISCAPGCAAGSWPRPAAASCAFRCRSGWSTTPRDQVDAGPRRRRARRPALLFATFDATGSAAPWSRPSATSSSPSPAATTAAPRAGELYWNSLRHDQVLIVLHNPAYAGAYGYGRARHVTDLDGHHHTFAKPPGEWTILIPGAHPGYITWAQFQANQRPGRQRPARGQQPPRRPAPRRPCPAAGPAHLRPSAAPDDRPLPHPRRRHPRPRLHLPARRHRERHADLPEHVRRRHRRRRRRVRAPGHPHPDGPAGRR